LFLKTAFATAPIIGMRLTCYHPKLDQGGAGGAKLVDIVASGLDSSRPGA
jgi:hypothetical protein